MSAIFAAIKKETVLLLRDKHALLALFLMPSVFVLIMSLALQEKINGESALKINGQITALESSNEADAFAKELESKPFLNIQRKDLANNPLFNISVNKGFSDLINSESDPKAVVFIEFSPLLGARERALIKSAVQESFSYVSVLKISESLSRDEQYAKSVLLKEGVIAERTLTDSDGPPRTPSSTQQSVPAWLVFSMFFISIPLSTTLINERRQKTLLRLKLLAISPWIVFGAKLLPYLLVNYCQLFLVLLLGVHVIPLFGGEGLQLQGQVTSLLLMTGAVSMAALGYAALIATVSRTAEQATILTGTINIIFGAVGGIMVPKFVMPAAMQQLVVLSPMGWGLNGFLDILVFEKSIETLLPIFLMLITIGVALLIIAILIYHLKNQLD